MDNNFFLKNRFVLPVLLMVLIVIFSSIPATIDQTKPNFFMLIDPCIQNLLHIPLFAFLSYFWIRALTIPEDLDFKKIFITLIILSVFGCLDEFHQTYVQGRYGSLLDIILNFIGIVLGIFFFCKKYNNKTNKSPDIF